MYSTWRGTDADWTGSSFPAAPVPHSFSQCPLRKRGHNFNLRRRRLCARVPRRCVLPPFPLFGTPRSLLMERWLCPVLGTTCAGAPRATAARAPRRNSGGRFAVLAPDPRATCGQRPCLILDAPANQGEALSALPFRAGLVSFNTPDL